MTLDLLVLWWIGGGLAIFTLGALFGAALTESIAKRDARSAPSNYPPTPGHPATGEEDQLVEQEEAND